MHIKISGIGAMAETWAVDPGLPPLGQDPYRPTSDMIIIPRGRLLAVHPTRHLYSGGPDSYEDETFLTIADGVSNRPIGYTESNIMRKWPQRIQVRPVASKQDFIALPYLTTINDLYGALNSGDRITAYFGSNVGAANPSLRGHVVKWVGRRAYLHRAASAGTAIDIPAANLFPFQPRVLAAFNNTGALAWPNGQDITLAWQPAGYWRVTFPVSVQFVLYEWGQDVDQIAGEVVRIQKIDAGNLMHGWLQWVTDRFADWDYPPMAMRVPTTAVTNEAPSHITGGGGRLFQLAKYPVAFWKPIKVEIQGSYVTEDGQTVTLSTWGELPLADIPYANWAMGKYHTIDPFTGRLTFTENVTISQTSGNYNVRVSYEYETSYRDGRLWASGQLGITDGSGGSGIPGMPAYLDVPGVAGELRVVIY